MCMYFEFNVSLKNNPIFAESSEASQTYFWPMAEVGQTHSILEFSLSLNCAGLCLSRNKQKLQGVFVPQPRTGPAAERKRDLSDASDGRSLNTFCHAAASWVSAMTNKAVLEASTVGRPWGVPPSAHTSHRRHVAVIREKKKLPVVCYTLAYSHCNTWNTGYIGKEQEISLGNKLDSTVFRVLDAQLVVHWLLLQFDSRSGGTKLGSYFIASDIHKTPYDQEKRYRERKKKKHQGVRPRQRRLIHAKKTAVSPNTATPHFFFVINLQPIVRLRKPYLRSTRVHVVYFSALCKTDISTGLIPLFMRPSGILPDDAAGRRVFSGISRFPGPCSPELLHTHFTSPPSALKTSMVSAAQISTLLLHRVNSNTMLCPFGNFSKASEKLEVTMNGLQKARTLRDHRLKMSYDLDQQDGLRIIYPRARSLAFELRSVRSKPRVALTYTSVCTGSEWVRANGLGPREWVRVRVRGGGKTRPASTAWPRRRDVTPRGKEQRWRRKLAGVSAVFAWTSDPLAPGHGGAHNRRTEPRSTRSYDPGGTVLVLANAVPMFPNSEWPPVKYENAFSSREQPMAIDKLPLVANNIEVYREPCLCGRTLSDLVKCGNAFSNRELPKAIDKPLLEHRSETDLSSVNSNRTRQQNGVTNQQHGARLFGNLRLAAAQLKADHGKMSTTEINLRIKSLPLLVFILTGDLSDMRPVRLVTVEEK
ncbi:hypothetical protein PR048_028068 [Dryococelus australis]|uniref:Uncharacterized protein n=1 Tax=Dryococelus australis TaxID=614101 RepID=A0ABQ9GI81_9NEOP|nr:hypothetical protein PR048_028068 [Dryococelus australis]